MIEIPGYRLLRQLGRGGMATVYLAVQESVDREVALKIMSPALLADPNFGERFLREAKIAARLHHRHVVGIHDVSRVGDYHYIAMEYLAGGAILPKDGGAREVTFALRVIREIATAINYAQQKGFIHRDIKPDNILLRDDGSSALTDFGIARANDSATRMTRTGAVVGTPHYMSPEQARGKQVDGRSDLYSLGVVLYEMLVGRVPYHADDSLAVGIMHITQPVPHLPEDLAVLQPLVNSLLAKEPKDRFQTGNEAATAIARYEHAIASGELEGLNSRSQSYERDARSMDTCVSPIPPADSPRPAANDGALRHRSDPSMGRLEEIMAATDDHIMRASRGAAKRVQVRAPRSKGKWLIVAALVLVLGGAFFTWKHQDRLRAFLPSTELNDMLARGQQALDAGKLNGSDGVSARELFQRARTIDPDNDIARRGLSDVGEKLLGEARAAIERSDLETAKRTSFAARELLGGGMAVDEVTRAIAAMEARGTETGTLIDQAQQALANDSLLGADGAIALYQRVLLGDPDNALAKAGINRCADALKAQVLGALEAGDATTAAARIEEIARIVPAYPELPDLRVRLGKQRDSAAALIDQDLTRAEAQLRAGRVSGSPDSAQVLFESVLQRDRESARARSGLNRVAQAFIVQAHAAIEDSNPGVADRLLTQAEALSPGGADLRSARIELRELRERLAIAAERSPASPADLDRLQKLIGEANLASENGRIIDPPGNSAYDKFRAALAIDGNNQAALDGLGRLPQRARQIFDQALAEKTLPQALSMLDAVRQLAPSDPNVSTMSARLATAFLDQAEARLAEGQREDVVRSLKAARDLTPNNPRLPALEQQLRVSPSPTD